MTDAIMIYGAYGYTGTLVTRRAVESGQRPVLAGRNPEKLETLAAEHGLDWVSFDVTDGEAMRQALADCSVLLNCAGPFIETFAPMTSACLDMGVHYLDITGEIDVLAGCADLDTRAVEAGITIMPGVGFDVVPTDCMAAMLKRELPDADTLTLAFKGLQQASRGTAMTAIPYLGQRPFMRKNGRVVHRTGSLTKRFDFGEGPETLYAISWGDVVTAWHTTGIGTIEVFMLPPADMVALMKMPLFLRKMLISPLGRPLLNRQLRSMPDGPDKEMRATGRCVVYGRASNAAGQVAELWLETGEGYGLTGVLASTIAGIAAKGGLPTGFQTPAGALGADFILDVDGCAMIG